VFPATAAAATPAVAAIAAPSPTIPAISPAAIFAAGLASFSGPSVAHRHAGLDFAALF